MMEEKFSFEQSLQVIQSIIEKVKHDVQDNSFYFLMWGWLVFITALLHFALMMFTDFKQPYHAWKLMLVGVIFIIIKGIKKSKKEKVKTYVGDIMNYFGISLGITYAGLAFIFGKFDLWIYSFSSYILLYALACFFYGFNHAVYFT